MFLDHVWLRFSVLLIVVLFKHRYEVLSEEEAGEEVYEVPIIQVSWLSRFFVLFCFVLFFANHVVQWTLKSEISVAIFTVW